MKHILHYGQVLTTDLPGLGNATVVRRPETGFENIMANAVFIDRGPGWTPCGVDSRSPMAILGTYSFPGWTPKRTCSHCGGRGFYWEKEDRHPWELLSHCCLFCHDGVPNYLLQREEIVVVEPEEYEAARKEAFVAQMVDFGNEILDSSKKILGTYPDFRRARE